MYYDKKNVYESRVYGYKFVDDYLLQCKIDKKEVEKVILENVNEQKIIDDSSKLEKSLQYRKLYSWWELEDEDIESAAGLAETLRQLNEERKVMTEQGVAQAIAQIEQAADADAPVLVIYLPQVHESVAGIIVGRIRERYERPTFILVDAADGNGAKGSGRSVEGFSM